MYSNIYFNIKNRNKFSNYKYSYSYYFQGLTIKFVKNITVFWLSHLLKIISGILAISGQLVFSPGNQWARNVHFFQCLPNLCGHPCLRVVIPEIHMRYYKMKTIISYNNNSIMISVILT